MAIKKDIHNVFLVFPRNHIFFAFESRVPLLAVNVRWGRRKVRLICYIYFFFSQHQQLVFQIPKQDVSKMAGATRPKRLTLED